MIGILIGLLLAILLGPTAIAIGGLLMLVGWQMKRKNKVAMR
jgi:hypothetical protein